MLDRLKRLANAIAAVFIACWLIDVTYWLVWLFGYAPPLDQVALNAAIWLARPVFVVAGYPIQTWRLVIMVLYTVLFVGAGRLLWPQIRRQNTQRQDAPAEQIQPATTPAGEQNAPPKVDARYRIEIPGARPFTPVPIPPTPPKPTEPPRPVGPITPSAPPAVEPRYRTEVVKRPPAPAAPISTPPKRKNKIIQTSADWLAAHPNAKAKINPNRTKILDVITLPPAKELPVIELGPPEKNPKIYKEKPRPPRSRASRPEGEKKPKRLRKYQAMAEKELKNESRPPPPEKEIGPGGGAGKV